jgi:hypothetical protein
LTYWCFDSGDGGSGAASGGAYQAVTVTSPTVFVMRFLGLWGASAPGGQVNAGAICTLDMSIPKQMLDTFGNGEAGGFTASSNTTFTAAEFFSTYSITPGVGASNPVQNVPIRVLYQSNFANSLGVVPDGGLDGGGVSCVENTGGSGQSDGGAGVANNSGNNARIFGAGGVGTNGGNGGGGAANGGNGAATASLTTDLQWQISTNAVGAAGAPGGAGTTGDAGAAGVLAASGSINQIVQHTSNAEWWSLFQATLLGGGPAGSGGGGGGGCPGGVGGGGGASANGGGRLFWITNEVYTDSTTSAGTFHCIGGNGGPGATSAQTGCGPGGGGGGSVGGRGRFVYGFHTGTTATNFFDFSGGWGGPGGNGNNNAGAASGTPAGGGALDLINLTKAFINFGYQHYGCDGGGVANPAVLDAGGATAIGTQCRFTFSIN